eukprot:scaffold7703_cov103-Isochrysis_galbana.AAC.8
MQAARRPPALSRHHSATPPLGIVPSSPPFGILLQVLLLRSLPDARRRDRHRNATRSNHGMYRGGVRPPLGTLKKSGRGHQEPFSTDGGPVSFSHSHVGSWRPSAQPAVLAPLTAALFPAIKRTLLLLAARTLPRVAGRSATPDARRRLPAFPPRRSVRLSARLSSGLAAIACRRMRVGEPVALQLQPQPARPGRRVLATARRHVGGTTPEIEPGPLPRVQLPQDWCRGQGGAGAHATELGSCGADQGVQQWRHAEGLVVGQPAERLAPVPRGACGRLELNSSQPRQRRLPSGMWPHLLPYPPCALASGASGGCGSRQARLERCLGLSAGGLLLFSLLPPAREGHDQVLVLPCGPAVP